MSPRNETEHFRRQISERRRLMYLESLIPLLQKKLREMKEPAYGSIRLTQNWDFLPGGAAPGNPTAAVAIRAADAENQTEYREAEEHLRAMIRERDALRGRQELFSCCLRALPEEQRFLVEAKLLEEKTWQEVETLYASRYGASPHRDTLRRHLRLALNAMGEIRNA